MQRYSNDELRRHAESRLPAKLRSAPDPSAGLHDLQALIHELQVHQIELEMQNEELRLAKS